MRAAGFDRSSIRDTAWLIFRDGRAVRWTGTTPPPVLLSKSPTRPCGQLTGASWTKACIHAIFFQDFISVRGARASAPDLHDDQARRERSQVDRFAVTTTFTTCLYSQPFLRTPPVLATRLQGFSRAKTLSATSTEFAHASLADNMRVKSW